MSKDQKIVAKKWSVVEPDLTKCFFGFPPLRHYLIRTAFGTDCADQYRENPFWSEDILVDRYLAGKKIKRILSLCCGFGKVEQRIISRLPQVEECLALDLAQGALEVAADRARRQNLDKVIRYECADLNRFAWDKDQFDLVIANGALHHLENLETVLGGIKESLTKTGLLYANEHVGASYQDYSPRQLELINAVAYLVPPQMRGRIGTPFRHGKRRLLVLHRFLHLLLGNYRLPANLNISAWPGYKQWLFQMLRRFSDKRKKSSPRFSFGILHDSQKAHLLKTDPSEGVRSAEIIPMVEEIFPSSQIRCYGGAILAYALDEAFYHGFDESNSNHQTLLTLLCDIEEKLTISGEVGIEHAIIIAYKNSE